MINGLDYRHAVCPVAGPGGAVTVDLGRVGEYLEQSL
jgi:hypothetical protein